MGDVTCLVVLADGRLASGSNDLTIRVRPLANLAVLAACGSAFEFEEVARAHRDQKCLGDLFDAAVVQSDERICGSDAAITRQAHVFDAISKVVTADDNEALVGRLVHVVIKEGDGDDQQDVGEQLEGDGGGQDGLLLEVKLSVLPDVHRTENCLVHSHDG